MNAEKEKPRTLPLSEQLRREQEMAFLNLPETIIRSHDDAESRKTN